MLELFDLPAHTLFVHAPAVLIPLVSAGAVAIALRPAWRTKYGWLVVTGAVVSLVSTLLAVSSGEAFDDFLDGAVPTERHAELGNQTRLFVTLLTVSIGALVWWGRRTDPETQTRAQQITGRVVAALTIVLAVAATVWVIRTGHEGARITWIGIFEQRGG